MNKPFKPAPADASATPLVGASATPIDAGDRKSPAASSSTGGASALVASTLPPLPICKSCGRNPYGCVCNAPDGTEDMTPVEDMKRIMPELFETGWARAERCAYLMGGGK